MQHLAQQLSTASNPSGRFYVSLLVAALTIVLLAVACGGGGEETPDGGAAQEEGPGGGAPQERSPGGGDRDNGPAPTTPPSESDGSTASSQVINGMLIDVTVTRWDTDPQGLKKSWADLVDVLRYRLHFSVKPGPGASDGSTPIEFQIFKGDSVFPFYLPSTDYAEDREIRQVFVPYQSWFILPGPGSYTIKGKVGGDEFEVSVEAVQPPVRFGALVEPGTWGHTGIDAGGLEGFASVEGTWTGVLPEGWQDGRQIRADFVSLSQLDFRRIDQFIEPVPSDKPQRIYDGTRLDFDLMLPRARYDGELRFYLAATGFDEKAGVCGAEIVTYELEGLLSYLPLGKVWGSRLKMTGKLVRPYPVLTEHLPQKVVITSAAGGDIEPVRFGFRFQDFEPNPDSVLTHESTCRSRMDETGLGSTAFRGSGDPGGGRITGRAVASSGSGASVSQGRAELRVDPSSQNPDYFSPIRADGEFVFTDIPVFDDSDGAVINYTLTLRDVRGFPNISIPNATEVQFAPATVTGVVVHTNHEIQLQAQTSPPTHFIAVGDRGVGVSISPVFHYSLEYWQCGGDFTPLNHTDAFTRPEIIARCQAFGATFQPRKLGEVELLRRPGWEVWAGIVDLTGTQKSWFKQDVAIAEIMYTGTEATELMPIYTGNAADVQAKWVEIIAIANTYRWAEQYRFSTGNSFTQWPRSMYKALQTNSNTFVRYLVGTSGLTMTEMAPGFYPGHPGNLTPSQNTGTDTFRDLTFYTTNTPWIGGGGKPEPSQPPR